MKVVHHVFETRPKVICFFMVLVVLILLTGCHAKATLQCGSKYRVNAPKFKA
jgi:hypothetical protein